MASSEIKVAVAEDIKIVRDGIIDMLHLRTPHKVVVDAENGAELISKIAQLHTPPDVCLLDISMPVLNGYDTAVALRTSYPHMKLLALTILKEEYCIIRMIKSGAHGYLLKNCGILEVGNAITAVYNDGYYYSNTASERAFSVIKHNILPQLTEKQLRFLCLCCSKLSFPKIAKLMNVSVDTLKKYQKEVGEILNIHNRIDLALFAVRAGLVPLNTESSTSIDAI